MATPTTAGDFIISKIIGKKPRVPQTYELRKSRGTEEDIEFCKRIDSRVADWNEKADKIRNQQMLDNAKDKAEKDAFVVKEVPPIIATKLHILNDFKSLYKQIYKRDFNEYNPYSDSDEPVQYVFTLVCYFTKDERFFDSPLLRKDLSEPSFHKGTLSIGGYGCGKTSTFLTLLTAFRNHVKFAKEKRPVNLKEILNKFDINSCVSTEVVNEYITAKDKGLMNSIMTPLMSSKQLYIDDIIREDDAFNFGKNNIFKKVLTHRSDRDYKTHLTLNPLIKDNGETEDINISLMQFNTRYDGRVHDRLFGNYNIIELKGKSFRR